MGVDVVDDTAGIYHVSGHANQPDILRAHEIFDPQIVIPMHGEHRHLRKHSVLAKEAGRATQLAVNGMMIELTGNKPKVVEYIETGRTYLDGSVQVGAFDGIIRDRIRMALNGHVLATIIIDEDDEPLGEPWVELMGLAEIGKSNAPVAEIVEADLEQMLMRAGDKTLADDDKLEMAIKKEVRRSVQAEIGKKPEVTVIVSRLIG
jgi:ribonuclease J